MIKLLQVYNQYRSLFNGEEAVVQRIDELIDKRGGESRLLLRSSRGIEASFAAKVKAACSGIYSRSSYREMRQLLRRDRPDVVHVHNLYPLFSPSVLVACRREQVPVVMTLHNHQLTCPKSDHLYQGSICERCVGGKEFHCVLKNCRGNLFESIAYAARSAVAGRTKVFQKNVTLFIALSESSKRRLVSAGFDAQQIVVLPNMAPSIQQPTDASRGQYFAYAGRMSAEKGIETILEAAVLLPQCPVRLAGDGPLLEQLKSNAPSNVLFVGRLNAEEMADFYRNARCLLHSSTCFEMCPLVISEAMVHGLPVIASNIGGREELIDVDCTGLLFEPGNAMQLATHMQAMWSDAERCRDMGQAGHDLASQRFGEDLYFENLLAIYRQAIALINGPRADVRSQPLSNASEHVSI